jgi:hypothetical protein
MRKLLFNCSFEFHPEIQKFHDVTCLMEIKDQFLSVGTFEVHNGRQTRFW